MDKSKIAVAVKTILEAVGEDANREGLKGTPSRVADMYEELLGGISKDAGKELEATFDEEHEELILIKDIQFYSLCEHHLLPFFGKVHIAYIPKGKVAGLSKFARMIAVLTNRLQVQERLTTQIVDTIMEVLNPLGVVVVVEAEHLCMSMRGVKKPGALIITSGVRGIFRTNEASRAEAFALIKGEGAGLRT